MAVVSVSGVESLTDLPPLLRASEGWADLAAALKNRQSGTIDGAWGSSAALAVAALAQSAPSALLVVLAHPGDVDRYGNDLYSFAGDRPLLFPPFESWPVDKRQADVTGQRLRVLQQLASSSNAPSLLVTTIAALMQPVPTPQELAQRGRRLRVGASLPLDEFLSWLVNVGYKRVEAVELPGEFSRRGGILDVFSPDAEYPSRVELFGDEIESIRSFNAGTQRSMGDQQECLVLALQEETRRQGDKETRRQGDGHLCDHLPADAWVVLVELGELQEQGKFFLESIRDVVGLFTVNGAFAQLMKFPNVVISAMPRASVEATVHLRVESVERFSGNVNASAMNLMPSPLRTAC